LALTDAEFDKELDAGAPQLSTEALLDSLLAATDKQFDFLAPP